VCIGVVFYHILWKMGERIYIYIYIYIYIHTHTHSLTHFLSQSRLWTVTFLIEVIVGR